MHMFMFHLFQIRVFAASIFLVFFVTLSLFPAVISQIKSGVAAPHSWLGKGCHM